MATQKRILAAASMAAGAETLAPVIKRLREQGARVCVLSHGEATAPFQSMKIEPDLIVGDKTDINFCLGSYVKSLMPNAVLTGTHAQTEAYPVLLEHVLWGAAMQCNIPSIAVLDAPVNLVERFSDIDTSATAVPGRPIKQPLNHIPIRIAVPDEFTKKEMLGLGFRAERLVVTGNPHFEHVAEQFAALSPATRQELLAMPVFSAFNKAEDAKLVVFLSDTMGPYTDIGFTEKSVMQSFFRVMDDLARTTGMKINVIARPHPVRNEDATAAYVSSSAPNVIRVLHHPAIAKGKEPENEYSMEQLLAAADLVVGVLNHPLITASVVGKAVVSYTPDMNPKYNFLKFLVDRGSMIRAFNEADLGKAIKEFLTGERKPNPPEAITGATDRVITLLE